MFHPTYRYVRRHAIHLELPDLPTEVTVPEELIPSVSRVFVVVKSRIKELKMKWTGREPLQCPDLAKVPTSSFQILTSGAKSTLLCSEHYLCNRCRPISSSYAYLKRAICSPAPVTALNIPIQLLYLANLACVYGPNSSIIFSIASRSLWSVGADKEHG